MDNIIGKETLLFIIIALSGYGVNHLNDNPLYGFGALGLSAVLLIVRAYLKKQGWDLAGKK